MKKTTTRLSANRRALEHVLRTTVAATVSLLVARLLSLPEAYWTVLTTLIVMQSTLGAAVTVSTHRMIGTALGGAAGALLGTEFGADPAVFAAGVLALGLLCMFLRLDRAAYRFAGITLVIVLLVQRDKSFWVIAAHRSINVALGIVTGLAMTALWPEHADKPAEAGKAEEEGEKEVASGD